MNILNGIALFIIMGIGADDIFIFMDTWVQSGVPGVLPRTKKGIELEKNRQVDVDFLADRLKYTYGHAGMAMLITTITTAGSFFSNMVSIIVIMKDFGVFMGQRLPP